MGETVSEPPGAGTSGVAAGILTAAAVVVLAVSWIVSDALSRRWGRLPPGPVGLPVIGNFLELMGSKGLPHRAMARLSRKYGPILFLKLGQAPLVLVSDQRLAKACLTGSNDKIFAGRPQMESIRRLAFGECPGIAMTPYGDAWRHVRKLCSLQLFTTRRVSEFEPLRRSEVMALVRRIKEQAGKKQEAVNLTQALNSLAEAVTSGLLLGKPLAEIGGGEAGVNMLTLVQRMTDLFQAPIIGEFIPALGFLDRGTRAALDQVHVGFEKLFSQLIPERQRRCPDSPQVILDVLLDNLDEDWAKSILMELIAAASDTSAATLDWAMAELVASPQAMKRLQEELDEVVAGEAATDRLIEEAELGKLVYLKAVLKETMRLHPPVPLLVPHMSMETCYVDGYKIPKGCRLLVNAWAIGRDPASWPDRPEHFIPERFLTPEGALIDFRGQHFELLPFGSGRRICPGLPLALPLIESTIANLVHTFDWYVPSDRSIDLSERFSTVASRASPLFAIPQLRHPTN
ncbi:hypothetical protein L7F22_018516 [Adiantum nelumboides]|nr:hypothetical protein [Adiantum nelumboides]